MTAKDDLEKVFAAAFGELLHPHVIDDQQVRLQVIGEHGVVLVHRLRVEEVADDVEDRAVVDRLPQLDGVVADGLGDVRR